MKAALAEYQARAETLERIRQRFETLRSKLQKLTDLGLDVKIRNNRMVISLPGDVLFASGSDVVSGAGEALGSEQNMRSTNKSVLCAKSAFGPSIVDSVRPRGRTRARAFCAEC